MCTSSLEDVHTLTSATPACVLATWEEMHVHMVSLHQVRMNDVRLRICVRWPSDKTSTHESSHLHV